MHTDWILNALADLTRYAEEHDMAELARHLGDARDVVASDASGLAEDRFSKLSRELGTPRRLH